MRVKKVIVAVLMLCVCTLSASAAKKSVSGTVTCDGKGVAGVVVTDGINLTKTDAKGAYVLPTNVKDPHCQFVHISIVYYKRSQKDAPFYFMPAASSPKQAAGTPCDI